MKLNFNILRNSIAVLAIAGTALFADAQATDSSSSSIRRGSRESREAASGPQVTQRMQQFFQDDASQNDASMQWMRIIYRTLDLEDPANSALYFPEEAVEGEENLFRLIMHLLADGKIQAYDYVDGRENFTDRNRLNVAETLDRF